MIKRLIAVVLATGILLAPGSQAAVCITGSYTGEMYCDCGDLPTLALPPDMLSKGLKSTANSIVRSIRTPDMSDYDLALALNDWLVAHTNYKSHTTGALNVLNNGFASCSGYANAYCALLTSANIPYKRVVGKVFRFTHVWNLVKLGGFWYHVDVRMNDSSASNLYFALSNNAISVNHSAFGKRNCNSFECNYGFRSGQYDEAIAYIESLVAKSFRDGVSAFMINPENAACPAPLRNPIMAKTIAEVVESRRYDYDGQSNRLKVSFVDGGIAVSLDRPVIKVNSISLSQKRVKITVPDNMAFPVTYQLTADVQPFNATNPTLFWKSRNEKVASVDQNGLVTFYKHGKVKIQALSVDYSKKIATCQFNIRKK